MNANEEYANYRDLLEIVENYEGVKREPGVSEMGAARADAKKRGRPPKAQEAEV